MARYEGRNYFLVRHDLASLRLLPGCIWNSELSHKQPPTGFRQVQAGDRWVGFAYTTSEYREKAVSMVTGFYESIAAKPCYLKLPAKARQATRSERAWIIKGTPIGRQQSDPVVIPPINTLLSRKLFNQRTVSRISKTEFDRIRNYTRQHYFSPRSIPCLQRDPTNEQEVLAIVASYPERYGIEKILRVQTRFPDMKVKLFGKSSPVHLELELYSSSFLNHDHQRRVRRHKFVGTPQASGDGLEVGVLCWIDDDEKTLLRPHVHRIYELRALIRNSQRIRW